ncbi:glucuronate isomerase [Sanguibacter antarcticus]|uniref:glucuronate isomerase n=1 Tax=Sanguibacter antarcticus TaxID=372484 RepID=UPI001FE6DA0C|nr:glucuronate isomerase [Sanguibacter antarcticus]
MTAQHAQTGTIPTSSTLQSTEPWTLHEDRALPAEPTTRRLAREIYTETKRLPILSMHGHVDARILDEDTPFGDPAELFVIPDHYLVRMIVSQGGSVDQMGAAPVDSARPAAPSPDHREIWRRFCASWKLFRGTPSRYWMEHELVEVFGITQRPSAETADAIYDQLDAALASPEFRPRALFERFDIETLATTDPAWSGLEHHASLAAQGWGERVVPTFRPDPLLELDGTSWPADIARLAQSSGIDVTGYASYLDALRQRRQAFLAAGARATDHGPFLADTTPLSDAEANRIFDLALSGAQVNPAEAQAFSGHMLFQMAAMSVEDGLVMQLHPGVVRNHDKAVLDRFGPNKGYDIPVQVEYTRALRPLLEAFGHHPGFRLIVFTIDETVYSRELAPLAGVYPAMKLGAPWWFLDTPEGMRRFRETATETAGFYNTTGFVDDTRAFASIPARHDLSRRIDAGYLARLVAEHRLDLDEAVETAIDLAYTLPRAAYARR